ncbi:hypothetical protein [Paraburkholderia sp. BCC1886]|uniref:T4 family baseplate hub assembly chaperone n=1 Tax=Paraburkholderia sp. BCC1886 TaxID=2562670 RepID=UPI001183ED13|nr:hypothetical protein [Paraburkholderia sp. BCC1886]
MRALDTPTLLDAWDRGHSLSADAWALWLLRAAAACETGSPDALLQWPVGRRDRALLRLRSLTFGTRIAGLVECPRCANAAEFDVAADALVVPHASGEDAAALRFEMRFDIDGLRVVGRAVTAGDLLAIDTQADLHSASGLLADCCVSAYRHDGTRVAAADLPEPVLAAIVARLEELDPQADLWITMACPDCDHTWQVNFDIVTFFWRELGAWAMGQLRDVHDLASVYGWSEAQILSLSPARRRCYLRMLTP